MWRYLVYSLRLRRVEYRIAELPIFLIPTLLTISDASAFLSAAFWEGLLIFFFLFAFGDLLNCLADRDLDAIYKPHLTEAVHGIGIRGVIAQAVLSALAAVALTAHLAWLLDRWLLVPLVLAGVFAAYAYSVEPIRLKSRGLWQLAFYWLGLFTGPMIFTALLFSPWPPWGVWAVAAAYGLMQTGVILVNTAEDYPEDRRMRVRTVIVALGLDNGITLALVLTVLGCVGLLASYAVLFLMRGASGWALLALLPLAGACVAVSTAIGRLCGRVHGKEEVNAVAAVKRSAHWVPVWITSLAVSSLVAAVVCFAGRDHAPTHQTSVSGDSPRTADISRGLTVPGGIATLLPRCYTPGADAWCPSSS
jgi:4-hydroxybenzoate polyprenyltransferase